MNECCEFLHISENKLSSDESLDIEVLKYDYISLI